MRQCRDELDQKAARGAFHPPTNVNTYYLIIGKTYDPNLRLCHCLVLVSNESKYGCKDKESMQSSTTPDPGYQWESDKLTVRHHKREPRGQPLPSR